jgi:hypothetical protein
VHLPYCHDKLYKEVIPTHPLMSHREVGIFYKTFIMKKLRMIVTSVIILAIVGSAFAFNAKKNTIFCYVQTFGSSCVISTATANQERVAENTSGARIEYYLPDWDGSTSGCTSVTCQTKAGFIND